MEIKILNNEFKHIRTAVCYKAKLGISGKDIVSNLQFKFISKNKKIDLSDIKENHIYNNVMYLGNTETIDNVDFAQYDFSYLIDKYKFNSDLLINCLDNKTKRIIGVDTDILSTLENTIFPSNIENEGIDKISYFGSTIFNYSRFFSLKLNELVYKLELYEDSIETNHDGLDIEPFIEYGINCDDINYIKTPAIIILFGPSYKLLENPERWYYPGSSEFDGREKLNSETKYRYFIDEILYNKNLNIYLPKIKDTNIIIPKINLSLETWTVDSKNSNRNTHKIILRNDDFYGSMNNIKSTQLIKNTYQYDTNSMTLLGNELIQTENLPILRKKINDLDKELWRPTIRYKSGDRVKLIDKKGNNSYWISILDNNIGNYPTLSSYWEYEENLTSHYTINLNILFKDSIGIVKPSNNLVITKYTDHLEINLIPTIGFDIVTNSIEAETKDGYLVKIENFIEEENKDRKYNYHHYVSQDLGHIMVFYKDQLLQLLENNIETIYINTKPIEFSVKVKYKDFDTNNELVNTNLLKIFLNKEDVTDFSEIKAKVGDSLIIKAINPDIQSIYLQKSDGNIINSIDNIINFTIDPTLDEDWSREINYTVQIKSLKDVFSVFVSEFNGFIVEKIKQSVNLGDICEIRFYSENNSNFSILINEEPLELHPEVSLSLDKLDKDINVLSIKNITNNLDIRIIQT